MTETDTPLDTPAAFRRRARFVVSLAALAVVLLSVLWITRQALLLVFLGVALGVLFYHASDWLSRKTGAPRKLMLGVVVLLVLGGLAAAGYFGAPRVATEAQDLAEQAPEFLEAARAELGLPESSLQLPQQAGQYVGRLFGMFSSLLGVLAGILVVLLVGIYTALSPGLYTEGAVRLFDREHQPFVRHVLGRMGHVLLAWFKGVAIAVVVLGAMALIGLTVIGVPGALALAAFAAALTVIPNFGPLIGWAPAVVVGFSQGTSTGLWTLGLAIAAQQVEGSIITPKVQGNMIHVGPALIVAGQIVFATLAGFLGVLLVVPILGVGLVLVQELYIGPFVEGEPARPPERSSDDD